MTDDEVQEALLKTGLNIVFCTFPETDKNVIIQAAHGDEHSAVIIRMNGNEFSGIALVGGTRDERKDRYRSMLASFQRDGLGKTTSPDRRPVHICSSCGHDLPKEDGITVCQKCGQWNSVPQGGN